MKLTMRDKVIVLILFLSTIIYGGYQMLCMPSTIKISELERSKVEVHGLTADITPLLKRSESLSAEKKQLEKSVNDIRVTGSKTLTKEEFLLYLGKCTTSNGVKLLGFNDFGTEENNGIYKAKFDFELQGSAANINRILSAIDQIGVKYSVGSLSYRQTKDYDYLKRFFDSMTRLPWYKEPEKTEEPQEEIQKESEEELPADDIIIPSPPVFQEQLPVNAEPIPSIQPTPTPTPTPDALIPIPSGELEDKEIHEPLKEDLEQTSFSKNYQVVLLTNNKNPTIEAISNNDMRLAVTICFFMFEKPDISNSFMTQQSEGV